MSKAKPLPRVTNRGPNPVSKPAGAPWFTIQNVAEQGFAEIKLRGYIGMPKEAYDYWTGEEYETEGAGTLKEFERELEALGPVKKIQLSIFSEGGDVFTGMAIHNLLRRHPAKKLCVIDGICASAATFPALACDTIQIPTNAWMMIHATSTCVCGNARDLRSVSEMLGQMDQTLVNLYAARTGKGAEEVRGLIEAETWMDGQKAVEMGFADEVMEPLQGMATRAGSLQVTNRAMLTNAPAEVLALFDMARPTNANIPKPEAMLKILTPILAAATDLPQGGGAGAAPAAAPAPAAAAPVVAPVVIPPVAETAPAPAAAPTGLTLESVQAMVTNAVKPFQDEVARLNGLLAAGVTNQSMGGTAPVVGAQPAGQTTPPPVDFKNLSPVQLIALGRKRVAENKAVLPLGQVPVADA